MSEKIPTDELARLALSYRALRKLDDNAPNAKTKKQLRGIESLARKLQAALISQEVSGRLDDQDEMFSRLGDVADQSQLMHKQDFRNFNRNSAARCAAVVLRRLFERHGLPFAATAANDDYENSSNSAAVEALLEVAALAGDRDMNADTARKWIELVIHEWESRARETIDRKASESFPIN